MGTKSVPILTVDGSFFEPELVGKAVRLFETEGLFVIRGIKFTRESQLEFIQHMGDFLDWNVCSDATQTTLDSSVYPGGHSDLDREYNERPDEYLLDWHIEQVYYKYPILAGAWNMTTFTADSSVGNTLFVDSTELYEKYSPEDQDFLSKCTVVWDKPAPDGRGPFYTKVVQEHPITSKPTLRVETDRGCYVMPTLHAIDGATPTQEDIERLDNLLLNLKSYLVSDESIRYTQRWEENDLLVVDLFKMYHAVLGGFSSGQRRFIGIGLRPKEYDNSKYTDPGTA